MYYLSKWRITRKQFIQKNIAPSWIN
jgi:hypothetical protein